MKAALDLLRGSRQQLLTDISNYTSNADYWTKEVTEAARNAASWSRKEEERKLSLQKVCTDRNDSQARLNQIDAAIALLEAQNASS